ncbi:MAG: transposase [Candidatus Omnitrophota bacterium]|nr:transposase [Candidatus Omnitrophota bacterium]
MSRIARFIEPNGFYHIISRALNETWIFRDNADFDHFMQLTHTAKEKFPIYLFHYVLMNTHFHMVLQTNNHTILSKHIAYLKWHYTMWVRKKYAWRGPLWRERYKSLPIENEDYLYACGMYIEYNPVRAGICADPADYPYSSYRKYHLGITDTLIDNYEISVNSKHSLRLDYSLDITKNIFSLSPAIGSNLFIKKCLSQK